MSERKKDGGERKAPATPRRGTDSAPREIREKHRGDRASPTVGDGGRRRVPTDLKPPPPKK